ncbi:DNA repair endonuclease uvh1 [Lathyrus oleraceus]|uniref:Phospholipid scramblase n=1 Tax=Pisum sativum TaxID=3888 RepID=A0A9D5BFQ5_PEA|nr:DNA repair endonuclease uvh1 [Pisum sativum]
MFRGGSNVKTERDYGKVESGLHVGMREKVSLQFHEHIITELLEDTNGGLVILSSGLSLSRLISSLLLLHSTSQGTLLILSPSSATLKSKINFHLKTLNPQFYQVPVEITADLPVNHRHSLYSSGSVCFITPRILIVDLLTNKLPASIISGLIILNAHSVSETSTEAFIVRIFRSLNRSAFVRVFSDRPQAMVSGFAKAERTMKCLHIRKLHLWPRFQVYVSQELEQDPPDVVDIRVPMSKDMMGIQKAIVEVMGACLKEMRKTNKKKICRNKQFAVVENPGLWNWTFTLKDIDGEILTDAGQYVIRFGGSDPSSKIGLANAIQDLDVRRPLTLAERAVAVALAISLDNDYFSRHGGW